MSGMATDCRLSVRRRTQLSSGASRALFATAEARRLAIMRRAAHGTAHGSGARDGLHTRNIAALAELQERRSGLSLRPALLPARKQDVWVDLLRRRPRNRALFARVARVLTLAACSDMPPA